MKKLFIELAERWKSESPDFWKKVTKYFVILGSAALGLITANGALDLVSLGLPQMIFTVCGYIVAIGYAVGLSGKFTKQ